MTPSDSDFPLVLRRRQLPICHPFGITINKGQGQSLENVGILTNPFKTNLIRNYLTNYELDGSRPNSRRVLGRGQGGE